MSRITSSATTTAGRTQSTVCSRSHFRPTRRRLRRPARPPPSSACPGTRRPSNTKTRKATGTPRRPPAAIVRTPTSRTRIDRRASRVGWVERSASHVVRTTSLPIAPPVLAASTERHLEAEHGWSLVPNACFRLASRHRVRRACRRGDGGRKRSGGPVQAHDRLRADDRLHLSRDQLFGAPAVGRDYIDAQQGWLYGYTNFNSVRFSTSPAVEVTMAVGARPTLGPFEFDIGAAYYYYPGELGPELSNYWEAHATVSYKLTDKITLAPTLAYAPNVLADRRLGHLRSRHALIRSAERIPSRRPGLDVVRRHRALAVRPPLERRRRERGRRRASAAGLHQLACRPDVHLPRIQARPQLHRHEPLERELLRADRRPRGHTGRREQSGQQSLRIALGPVRRDVLGNTRFRHQPCDAGPLTTSCASRFWRSASRLHAPAPAKEK